MNFNKNYKTLKETYKTLSDLLDEAITINTRQKICEIQDKLLSLSIWMMAELKHCEIDWIDITKYKQVQREPIKGDIICITKSGQVLGNDFIGKYYYVDERKLSPTNIMTTYLKTKDTYYGGSEEIQIALNEDQYIILEELKEKI